MNDDKDFSGFLRRMRKEENVLLEQLVEGLMAVTQLARIEKGQRIVCKGMRERLMGRLGISSDQYENLLNIEDYAAWEQQQGILDAVERKDCAEAQKLLALYEEREPQADRIKQQFCMAMRAEVLRQQDAEPIEIGDCYEKALRLTVPDVEHPCTAGKLLSVQEVNIVLEYGYYHRGEDFAEKCRELMTFVEDSAYDDLSKAKIYPKIVCYYLRELFHGQNGRNMAQLGEDLEICGRAIAMLRGSRRTYYLLELLEMRIKIVQCMGNTSEELQAVLRQDMESADSLKKLYAEYEVPAYMQDCVYLYRQRWVFYIGDALRIRRKMFGLTRRELCEGICSEKTLRRVEQKEANMQHDTLCALLEKLGLPNEFQSVVEAEEITGDEIFPYALKASDLYDMDEVYLTELEMLCVCQRIRELPDDFLPRIFEQIEKENPFADIAAMYERAVRHIISGLGERQQTDDFVRKVIREALKGRRLWGIDE